MLFRMRNSNSNIYNINEVMKQTQTYLTFPYLNEQAKTRPQELEILQVKEHGKI